MTKWNRRTKVVLLSVILALIFIAIYAAGVMLPEELTAPSIRSTRLPPSLEHFFGTDALGRDLFFRTLKGLSVSMTVGLIASVISAVIAVFVGIAAAMGSRRVDNLINWIIDLMMGVPHMVLIMLISVAFGRGLKGLSVSMTVGMVASLISAVVAVFVGIAAATGSKLVDSAINWVIDLVMGVPHTVLVILISFAMGRGLKGLLIGIAATHWCSLARLIRGEVLQLRSQQYVAVSRKLGKSSGWILTHHLLPHLVPQFFVGLILMFPHAILHEASVSFLGYGLPPEQPAIGIILSESMKYISAGMWWPAVFPGAVLVAIVLLVDKLGDNLRMIIDPYSAQE